MSSHVVVISTDLRRATVKVTSGTYLSDVLDQACKKLNIDADKFSMKHKQKTVDLSIPFRTSGLVTGAKLELVQKSKTPSAVQIALQVPQPEAREIPGGRLIKRFPSDLSIWQILRQFESGEASAGKNVNITARGFAQMTSGGGGAAISGGGQLYYEAPVLNIMGRELSSFAQFQKTMSQLGHNDGNVLIRLSFRKTDQTLYDAMAEIGQHFKEEEEEESPKEEERPAPTQDKAVEEKLNGPAQGQIEEDGVMTDVAPTEDSSHQEASPLSHTEENPTPQSKFEPVSVFLAPSGSTPVAALAPVEDNDFTPSIAHAQLHQQRLLESSRNKRLLSDREIQEKEDAEKARIAAVKSALVKIRFPDNTSSDWQISPADTGAFLYSATRHVMASPEQPFHLVIPGSKTAIKDMDTPSHSLIKEYKFSGRVLVNLLWDDGVTPEMRKQPFLKNHVANRGQAVKVQDIPTLHEDDQEEDVVKPPAPQPAKNGGGDGSAKKVPKWLKLGKK